MKKNKKQNHTTKLALLAGTAALAALVPQAHAQSSDALIDKLVSKGILTQDEAKDLREDADKDFNTAYKAKTGMPDWVTSWKIGGDFRGRFDQISQTDFNANSIGATKATKYTDRARFRYRLRFGFTANIQDSMEVGFRLASGDPAKSGSYNNAGNPMSANSTMQDNGTKKDIYIDTAYAKWTAINSGDWLMAGIVGKMDNPFQFTPMVFDADYTPEGAAISGSFTPVSETDYQQTIAFTSGAFVLDEVGSTTQDPFLYGGQVLLNSKWSPKLSSSIGGGAFQICSPQQLTVANVPYINQGNTYNNTTGALVYHYNPIIGDANVTYTLDSFPFYTGAFPIKVGGEIIDNTAVNQNNMGYWVGATLGKSGTKGTWDLSYRYEWLEADAWYCQLVDDDPVAVYEYKTGALAGAGAYSGTNIKGHMVKLNYSITDYLTFSVTGFVDTLINSSYTIPSYGKVTEPNSTAVRVFADLMWKF